MYVGEKKCVLFCSSPVYGIFGYFDQDSIFFIHCSPDHSVMKLKVGIGPPAFPIPQSQIPNLHLFSQYVKATRIGNLFWIVGGLLIGSGSTAGQFGDTQ